ncbi:MAG: permease-like cell division protein FtsX [Nitrospirota bacterium]|nr:permease-like cell division protein FtsX [Nitrospirota bacterium]
MATYPFRLALRSILHEKWINLLSVLAIAVSLLMTALTVLSVYNVDVATQKLPERFSMMLYLKDTLSGGEVENIMNTLKKEHPVESVKYISKDQALKELKTMLKGTEHVLEGLEGNPLPDSIEIKLKKKAVGPETAQQLAARVKEIKGVDDVEYGEKFLFALSSIKIGVKTIGILFIVIMSASVIFVCYSTVKILFYRKKEEIETYKLLGATKGFIRAPFIIEGAFIGLSGGILSLLGILLVYYIVIFRLSHTIPIFNAFVFPADMSFLLPPVGLFLGIAGAAIAIGRIKY